MEKLKKEQSKHLARFNAVINRKKNPKWHSRNFFFVTTIFIVLLNILLFVRLGNSWGNSLGGPHSWGGRFNIDNLFRIVFVNGFSHSNLQHALLNMLCFFIVGLYLERKLGSLKFLALVFTLAVFSNVFTAAISQTISFVGFSATNFALYFFVIVDYISYHLGKNKSKQDTITGAVIVALIYLAMCFSGGTTGFSFSWYPYDLLNNVAHYSGAIAGLSIALLIKISTLYGQSKLRNH